MSGNDLIKVVRRWPRVIILLLLLTCNCWYVLCVSLSKRLFKLRDSLSFPIDQRPFPPGPECLQCRWSSPAYRIYDLADPSSTNCPRLLFGSCAWPHRRSCRQILLRLPRLRPLLRRFQRPHRIVQSCSECLDRHRHQEHKSCPEERSPLNWNHHLECSISQTHLAIVTSGHRPRQTRTQHHSSLDCVHGIITAKHSCHSVKNLDYFGVDLSSRLADSARSSSLHGCHAYHLCSRR